MSRSPLATRAVRRLAVARLVVMTVLGMLAAGLGLAGCSSELARDPLLREPALLIDGPALARVLGRTSRLVGTPAGHISAQLLER